MGSNKVQEVLKDRLVSEQEHWMDSRRGHGKRRLYKDLEPEQKQEQEQEQEQEVRRDLQDQAKKIIDKHVTYSMGVGILPWPLTDIFGGVALQLQMILQLSKLYGISSRSFNQEQYALTSLLTGLLSELLMKKGVLGLTRFIPGLSWAIRLVAMPIFYGAFTYAVGMVFLHHFQQGGTFNDLDRAKIREHLRKEFQRGKEIVTGMKTSANKLH